MYFLYKPYKWVFKHGPSATYLQNRKTVFDYV